MPTYKITLVQTYQQETTINLSKASEAEAIAHTLELDKAGELEYKPVEFIETQLTATKVEAQP